MPRTAVALAVVVERVAALDKLMEARFVTYRTLIDSQAEKVALALNAAQTAIDKAEVADEKARDRLAEDVKQRFQAVNEFRGQLADQAGTFMPRSEAEQRLRALSEKVDELKATDQARTGKTVGTNAMWGYVVGAVGVLAVILSFVVK